MTSAVGMDGTGLLVSPDWAAARNAAAAAAAAPVQSEVRFGDDSC